MTPVELALVGGRFRADRALFGVASARTLGLELLIAFTRQSELELASPGNVPDAHLTAVGAGDPACDGET